MYTYISRKTYTYDWSILIATIAGREAKLQRLLATINELKARICPTLRIEICISFDNREKKIGAKRQELLQSAKGKYFSFIDDDDLVTGAYFEDALETIRGGFHCCRLRGQMSQYTFTHSIENTLDKPMCEGDVFLRPPNHLNVIMTGVGRLVSFKDITNGEDLDWTIRLAQTGWIRTEYTSDPSRIHYIYDLGLRTVDPGTAEYQRKATYQMLLKMVWRDGRPYLPDPTPQADIRKTGLRLSARGFVSK
jgi:glycosyltransferase involved in cell wall biosynthesis